MSNDHQHAQGAALYQIVPSLYRERDSGDLARYFDGAGHLLDQIKASLDQRLADAFPDNPIDGSAPCQDWLIPYFAELFDVRLVSPLAKGRRDEVANAVRWRQGKGTLWVIEEVAEAIGQMEVVLQEGWQRLALTPSVDTPLIPATAYGEPADIPGSPPPVAAHHPGLPGAMVDLRCSSAAVAADSANPGAQQSVVDGRGHWWRQANLHAAPRFPGSYEDRSRRTVDFRDPDWRVGHYHPDRILLFTPPPAGWFDPAAKGVNWSETPSATFLEWIEVIEGDNTTTYRNRSYGTEHFVPVNINKVIKLGQEPDGVGDADARLWRFEGVNLMNTLELDSGRVELVDCAARKVEVHSIDYERPVITARHCLIKQLQAARGVSLLEYCTVLADTLSEILLASDCLFLGAIRKDHLHPTAPESGCVRYSRVVKGQAQGGMHFFEVTHARPEMFSTKYGQRACGVLHPATPEALRHGAEDGGEMGCYHDYGLCLLAEAVVDKLQDYLPLGRQAVVIPDVRMLSMPG